MRFLQQDKKATEWQHAPKPLNTLAAQSYCEWSCCAEAFMTAEQRLSGSHFPSDAAGGSSTSSLMMDPTMPTGDSKAAAGAKQNWVEGGMEGGEAAEGGDLAAMAHTTFHSCFCNANHPLCFCGLVTATELSRDPLWSRRLIGKQEEIFPLSPVKPPDLPFRFLDTVHLFLVWLYRQRGKGENWTLNLI